jgi:tetratricopeptide (TPR) repeat protein
MFGGALIGMLAPFPLAITRARAQDQSRVLGHPEIKSLPSKEKRWALIIGVDKYEDENITPLRGGTNDATAIARALKDYAGFSENQIILLTNDQSRSRQPTRLNILRYLSNLKEAMPKDGLLLISFSGHGVERNGHAFLIPSDALYTEDIRLLQQTAISADEITQDIKESKVRQVLILLDACRNDPVSGKADSANPLTEAYVRGFDFDVRNQEVIAFATLYATSLGSRAYEDATSREGYFTLAVVEALSGKAANAETGEVTLQSLVQYIETTVPIRVAVNLGRQKIQQPFAVIEGYKANELVLAVGNRKRPNLADARRNSGERAFWEEIEKVNTQESYESFLKAFPSGEYAAVASFKLGQAKAVGFYKRGASLGFFDPDAHITNFSKAIELNPTYREAYEARGVVYLRDKKDYNRAIADFTKAIDLGPRDAKTYNFRGLAYDARSDYDQAVTDYTQALMLDSTYMTALSNRGLAYQHSKRYDLALRDLTKVVETVPNELSYSERGSVYLDKRDYDRAIADFDRALYFVPSCAPAYNGRAQAYLAKGDTKRAIADYTKAIEASFRFSSRGVNSEVYYNNRGLAYFANGDYDLAIADYTKANELNSDDASVYRNRANAYEAKGDVQKAKADRKTSDALERPVGSPPINTQGSNASGNKGSETEPANVVLPLAGASSSGKSRKVLLHGPLRVDIGRQDDDKGKEEELRREFTVPLSAALSEQGLIVEDSASLNERDQAKIERDIERVSILRPTSVNNVLMPITERNRLRWMQYALVLKISISLSEQMKRDLGGRELPPSGRLPREVTAAVSLFAYRTENEELIGSYVNNKSIAHGHGATISQARRNALRSAAQMIPGALIKKIAENSK